MAQGNAAVKQATPRGSEVIDITNKGIDNVIAMRGTVMNKLGHFSDPAIARLFANQFPYINSRLYVIQVYAPNVVSSDTVRQCTDVIENLLIKDTKKVNNLIEQITTLIKANMGGVGEKSNPSTIRFIVNSRLSNVVFKYFELCDEYIGLVSSAWMDGFISDEEKSKALDKIRANVHSITATTKINSGRIFNLVREANAARNKPAPAPEISAATPSVQTKAKRGQQSATEKALVKGVIDGNAEALKQGQIAGAVAATDVVDDLPVSLDIVADSNSTLVEAQKELASADS
ncbi:MAG: hypothetical protein ACTS9Y_00950 [Methylophilus sp.]|uniref:hypothetical protein n=1 Tax=Methylophilus sp. TaxID=29541 RepID=UPI003F9EE626